MSRPRRRSRPELSPLPIAGWAGAGQLPIAPPPPRAAGPHDARDPVEVRTVDGRRCSRIVCRCGWRSGWHPTPEGAWAVYGRHYERMSARGLT
jgi:hypothetical protein